MPIWQLRDRLFTPTVGSLFLERNRRSHSSCAFPGVQRYVGATEIAQYRRRRPVTAAGFTNALDVDDNDHPKAIWSFIFLGRPFQN